MSLQMQLPSTMMTEYIKRNKTTKFRETWLKMEILIHKTMAKFL